MRALAPTLLGLSLLAGAATALGGTGIEATRHNLSSSGPGPVRSSSEDEICVFCHASHVQGGQSPLWNRESDGAIQYQPYESPTLSVRADSPDGASRLCLSCHDGTIAIGAVRSRETPINMLGTGPTGRLSESASSNLGRDLSGTHPVSLRYDSALGRGKDGVARTWLLSEPQTPDGRSLLDTSGKVQCTSCHDAHSDPAAEGASVPPFWRGSTFSEVCTSCHVAPSLDTSHEDPGLLPDACGSCHVGHGVSQQPLLTRGEEGACYSCHGAPAEIRGAREAGDLTWENDPVRVDDLFAQPYSHPVDITYGEHSDSEDMRSEGAGVRRHVECADCHPMHGSGQRISRERSSNPGSWIPVRPDGRTEHELCYDCHSSNANLPFGETDKSVEFDTSNASYHPIEAPVSGAGSPSLLSPWISGDTMTCSDCHGPDGENEPVGPHGSSNPWILKDRYLVTDGSEEAYSSYEACYSCHSRETVLSGATFEGHPQHVVDNGTACYTCHDSHGSPDFAGLIRFNKDIRYGRVDPSSSGRLEYDGETGACYLSCHGVDHDPLSYP